MNMFTIVCVQQTSVTHALTLFFHLFPPYRLFISVVISFPHFFLSSGEALNVRIYILWLKKTKVLESVVKHKCMALFCGKSIGTLFPTVIFIYL